MLVSVTSPTRAAQLFLEKIGGRVIEGLARFLTQQLLIAVSPLSAACC